MMDTGAFPRWLLPIGSSLLLGCSGASSSDAGEDQGGGTTTHGDNGFNTDPGSDDSTTHGGMTGDSAADEPCFEPPEPGPAVTITLRNEGDVPVLIHNTLSSECWGDHVPLEISGNEGPLLWRLVTGTWSCNWLLQGVCEYGCGGDQGGVCILPGGTYEDTWAGSAWTSTRPPPGCPIDATCGNCYFEEIAPSGSYTISAGAYVEACECMFNMEPAGWCLTESFQGTPALERTATIDYPTTTEVELVFP